MKFATCIAAAILLSVPSCLVPQSSLASSRQEGTATTDSVDPATQAGMLEVKLRQSAIDSPEFGRTLGAYWAVISETRDFPRAYSFFESMQLEPTRPNATLLAEKASSAGSYVGWLYLHHAEQEVGDTEIRRIITTATTQFDQALTLEPDSFAALYGYAVFEGYRPDGKEHQKQLLARLDSLRLSRPYLPWALVDHLEKTGSPQ